jgi:dipeptidyl aminopeptidase/acylaminoacyl peptidase
LREEFRSWSSYRVVRDFIGTGQHIDDGSPARHADALSVPVLMFHGTVDRNVSVEESRLMQSRLIQAGKNARLVEYDGLDHYLDDSAARADMLRQSAEFLKRAIDK